MFYLSQMLGKPVTDATGETIGKISDLAIATGEVFPCITSLAFLGPEKTPFMISWRKYVEAFDEDGITLKVGAPDIRFSYLQPDEVLLSRDLMSKQIVDTQGLKVVRVNDLKLSSSGDQLRLLGAEVGIRGILRGISSHLEAVVLAISKLVRHPLKENIIAWSYMDLLERDLSQVKLSVSHRRLHELHPADVADILEQLEPRQRALAFAHLDNAQAAETISELEDEYQSDVIDDLSEDRASTLLAQMDPDDAADIIGDLPYGKAETLLRLMGVREERAIRSLLGYKEKTAGGIMTSEFFAVSEETTIRETVEKLRSLDEDHEPVQYVYTVDDANRLTGVISMRTLVLADDDARVGDLAYKEDLQVVLPDVDQEEVAREINKYSLLAMPVVDEDGKILGIVTIDDALDVIEEEHDEDLAIVGASRDDDATGILDYFKWFLRREFWLLLWAICAIVVLATSTLHHLAGALVLMPLVLLVADDAATYSINSLVDYADDEEVTLSTIFVRDLVTGLLVALLAWLIISLLVNIEGDASDAIPITLLSSAVLPASITILVTILFTTLASALAKHRHDRGKVPSGFRVSIIMMVFSCLLLLGLTYAAGSIGLLPLPL
ncbi:MAG: magnesium transporter [Coriobacteriales bacterium]|nr:magnesium transporter [Coriobacteriales bacterium]